MDEAKLILDGADFDGGNADGSWPDRLLRERTPTAPSLESGQHSLALCCAARVTSRSASDSGIKTMSVLQPYRAPHIPMVSDRYGIYLFEQAKRIDFAAVTGPITNFDYTTFLDTHQLGNPKASNFFVAI